MGLSSRRFLLDQNDHLYRLPDTKFLEMLRDPVVHPMPRFAGARVRMSHIVVELVQRRPARVVWRTFSILTFDEEGRLDPGAFDLHQRARAELALAPLTADSDPAATVLDAAARFVAQGGRWTPSGALARRIDEAALDRAKCPRL